MQVDEKQHDSDFVFELKAREFVIREIEIDEDLPPDAPPTPPSGRPPSRAPPAESHSDPFF